MVVSIVLAEFGPGAMIGERAVLEGVVARSACDRHGSVPSEQPLSADRVDRSELEQVA